MKDTANSNCRELLDVLVAHGLRTLVASPGSRNAPLLIGASSREELDTIMINDERMAAFYALGIAMSTQRPVALACTSGTALYNYAPAVAEAYYQKIPLIVISADRPSQWIDQDDSQTLHQYEALGKIVKKSFDIPAETGMSQKCQNGEYGSEREWFVNRIANEAYLVATTGQKGPVHINIQFATPLETTQEYCARRPRIVEYTDVAATLPFETAKEICEYLMDRRVMVVAGFMQPDHALNKALMSFCRRPNVTLLCETLSNLHIGEHSCMVDSLLVGLPPEEKEALRPDVIISIGGALVSRMLKEYLRSCTGAEHWTLGDTSLAVDCFQRLNRHISVKPLNFFKAIGGVSQYLTRRGGRVTHASYKTEWQRRRDRIFRQDADRLSAAPWSELKALSGLFQRIPSSFNLFLSNGTVVRYAQLLLDTIPHGCYCNRGVSGIEGTNATAAGMAYSYPGPTLLVTGDMSFAYCTEILNPRYSAGDLRIAVINNSGGGIFRFIGSTRGLEQREQYFCSSPELPIERIAEAYGRPFRRAADEKELEDALRFLFDVPRAMIEIVVEPEQSATTLIERLTPKK